MIICSPLDQFEVVSLLGFSSALFGNFYISLTNFGLYSLIVLFIITGLHLLGNNNYSLIPSKWSVFLESIYVTILSMVKSQIGSNHEVYLPLIYSFFFFILVSNLVGNITYSYTITTSVILCLGLSIIIFIGFTILAISIHKFNFLSTFVPDGSPLALVPLLVLIELISYFSRSVSLRLFANIFFNVYLSFLFGVFMITILVFMVCWWLRVIKIYLFILNIRLVLMEDKILK